MKMEQLYVDEKDEEDEDDSKYPLFDEYFAEEYEYQKKEKNDDELDDEESDDVFFGSFIPITHPEYKESAFKITAEKIAEDTKKISDAAKKGCSETADVFLGNGELPESLEMLRNIMKSVEFTDVDVQEYAIELKSKAHPHSSRQRNQKKIQKELDKKQRSKIVEQTPPKTFR